MSQVTYAITGLTLRQLFFGGGVAKIDSPRNVSLGRGALSKKEEMELRKRVLFADDARKLHRQREMNFRWIRAWGSRNPITRWVGMLINRR